MSSTAYNNSLLVYKVYTTRLPDYLQTREQAGKGDASGHIPKG
jgi:hypothetical protein